MVATRKRFGTRRLSIALSCSLLAGAVGLAAAPARGGSVPRVPPLQDLLPVEQAPHQYLVRDAAGQYTLVVRNASKLPTPREVSVLVTFPGASPAHRHQVVRFGIIRAMESASRLVKVPAECRQVDCNYWIWVDYANLVPEADEANNDVDGTIIG